LRVVSALYAGLDGLLDKLDTETATDAILHFGLAGGRKNVTVETRARNRVSRLHADTGGCRPAAYSLVAEGPASPRVQIPTAQIVAQLRRAGITARLSQDAGNYVCNAALYHSVTASHRLPVGFIHIPWPKRSGRPNSRRSDPRPNFAALTKAAEIALLNVARAARTRSPQGIRAPLGEHKSAASR